MDSTCAKGACGSLGEAWLVVVRPDSQTRWVRDMSSGGMLGSEVAAEEGNLEEDVGR